MTEETKIEDAIEDTKDTLTTVDPVTTLLYLLMRDHLPAGDVFKLVKGVADATATQHRLSSKYMGAYAREMSMMLHKNHAYSDELEGRPHPSPSGQTISMQSKSGFVKKITTASITSNDEKGPTTLHMEIEVGHPKDLFFALIKAWGEEPIKVTLDFDKEKVDEIMDRLDATTEPT